MRVTLGPAGRTAGVCLIGAITACSYLVTGVVGWAALQAWRSYQRNNPVGLDGWTGLP